MSALRLTFAPHWNGNGIMFTPSVTQTLLNKVNIAAKFPSPLGVCQRNPVMGNGCIPVPVIGLLMDRSPSTVFRRIVTVIVDSVYAVFGRWSFTHVRKEGREAVRAIPSDAHGYSASTVPMVVRSVCVGAALPHVAPNMIQRVVAFIVGDGYHRRDVFLQASAGFSVTTYEVSAMYDGGVSATAQACPPQFSARAVFNALYYNHSTKGLVSKVCIRLHSILRQNIRKLNAWQADTVSAFQSLNLATGAL